MSFFSVFKQRKPRSFNMPTRYYDPIKDDLHERVRAKQREMSLTEEQRKTHAERIAEAYDERRRYNVMSSGLRIVFVILFLLIFIGYLYYGNLAFVAFLLIAPIYFVFKRLKKV